MSAGSRGNIGGVASIATAAADASSTLGLPEADPVTLRWAAADGLCWAVFCRVRAAFAPPLIAALLLSHAAMYEANAIACLRTVRILEGQA